MPDVQSNVGLDWAADAGKPWPGPFFKSVTEHIRIFEFTYNADLRSNFSWTTFLDLGGSFIDCIASSEQVFSSSRLLRVDAYKSPVRSKRIASSRPWSWRAYNQRGESQLSKTCWLATAHFLYRSLYCSKIAYTIQYWPASMISCLQRFYSVRLIANMARVQMRWMLFLTQFNRFKRSASRRFGKSLL